MENNSPLKTNSGYVYISQAAELARLTEALRGTARASLDTEADSLHHYFEKVCLIQLTVAGTHYVIDPLANLPLAEFLEALSQKDLILHGADYDLRMLKKTFGFRPQAQVFDTMLAAQCLGYEKFGLAALVEKFFGTVLSKTAQKSDWSRRPLTPALLTYASDDTKYLESIADTMAANLRELNRVSWHKECCERAVNTAGLPDKSETKEAWRVKGSSKMPPRVLIFVRELWQWRDAEAQRRDRPTFMVLKNEDLIELAEWRAANPQVLLDEGPSFLKRINPEPRARLEKALLIAQTLPAAQWPEMQKRMPWPDKRADEGKVDLLLAACKNLAAELKIESYFLAPRAVLTAAAQHQPQTVASLMEVSGMMRWQAELLLPAVKSILG